MTAFAGRDSASLIDSAFNFADYPGAQNDISTKEFLDQFPLAMIINALQDNVGVQDNENILIACLERIFRTKFGASLIPQYLPFIYVGLRSDFQSIRSFVCKTVSFFVENCDRTRISPGTLLTQCGIYPLLLESLVEGNENVAAASMTAIQNMACLPECVDIIFAENEDSTNLLRIIAQCSSLGKVRILSLIVKLFSISSDMASRVHKLNWLSLFEAEVGQTSDKLVILSILELIYELAQVSHGSEFLSKTSYVELLSSFITSASDAILRSRAMVILGRLLSSSVHVSGLQTAAVLAIDRRLVSSDNCVADEYECALEALGQIGASTHGATLILSGSPPVARHVFEAAFSREDHGKQLAALHALNSILGSSREGDVLLGDDEEEIVRILMYDMASKSLKLSPSGILLSLLHQGSEDIRISGYGVLSALAARHWFLKEACVMPELVDTVIHASSETTKIGMEARIKCCEAIYGAFISTDGLQGNSAYAGLVVRLRETISRGPYALSRLSKPQPAVMTADRV